MTFITTNPLATDLHSISHFQAAFGKICAGLRDIFQSMTTRWRLEHLSDRYLKDIGLTRHDATLLTRNWWPSDAAATIIHLRSCNW